MEDAISSAVVRIGKSLFQSKRRRFSDHSRPSRAPDLISDNTQSLTLSCQAHNGQHEILAARAIYPAESKNQMVRSDLANRLITSQFRAPISSQRIR
jgi:hypothetical protein